MASSRRRAPARRAASPRLPSQPTPVGPPPTAEPYGQPMVTARPLVAGSRSFIVVPMFAPHDPRSRRAAGPHGSAGAYEVLFALAVPGLHVAQQEINLGTFVEQGDSFLEVAANVQELHAVVTDPTGTQHTVRVGINEGHRLRDLRLTVTASGFDDAAKTAHDIVMPLLSRWAFLHDVAITTSGMQLTEAATQTCRIDVTVVGAVKAFSDTEGETDADHRPLLAAYREGLSSSEPAWQALCFYKVAEGVWHLRDSRRQAAVDAGVPVRERGERVPSDVTALGHPSDLGDIADALRPYAGKKFRVVFNDIRGSLRNAIAHLDPDGDPLAQDNWDDLRRVRTLLPGLRWMSRELLAAELHEVGQLLPPQAHA